MNRVDGDEGTPSRAPTTDGLTCGGTACGARCAGDVFAAPPPSVLRLRSSALSTPFNLEATVRLLQRRPGNEVDRWEQGRYLRAFATPEGVRVVAVANAGTIEAPDLTFAILGGGATDETAGELAAVVRSMLGVELPEAPTDWLAEVEPRAAAVAAALRGFRPPCFPTLFETGASVLPFQQLSLDAGVAILGRLVTRFGPKLALDGRTWHAFPSPAAIATAAPADLRGVGLSRAKTDAIQALARAALAGDLDAARFAALPSDAARKDLRRLPGIGPWSADLILLRGLRRMDVFPPGDVGAARNLSALLGLQMPLTPADASAVADRFGDRRGYLYFLCLGAQLLARGLIAPADGRPPVS